MFNRHRLCTYLVLSSFALVLLLPAVALAQTKPEESSHWGVAVSYGSWTALKDLQKLFLNFDSDELLEGTEFAIGVARGKARGGHWSVSYVSKPVKNKTATKVEEETSSFGNSTSFFRETTTTTFTDVKYTGVEALKYINFVTIKGRAQIGLNAGGGVATMDGVVDETVVIYQRNTFNNQVTESTQTESQTVPASEYVLYKLQPLFKLELAGSVIPFPGLKVMAAWGLNGPGTGFRIAGIYLFGAN